MAEKASAQAKKRINFLVSQRAFNELSNLSKTHNVSKTELVRIGLGLVKAALEAREQGYKLIVAKPRGDGVEGVRELVIPN